MNRLLTLLSICLPLFGALVASAATPGSVPLSNQLPKPLVQQILDERLWAQAFDEPGSPSAQELGSFWNQLAPDSQQSVSLVVDQLFGSNAPDSPLAIRLPRLYPVKVLMLRYAREHASASRAQRVADAWIRRYVEMAISTLSMAQVKDLAPILTAFKTKILSQAITIHDLSPEERRNIQSSIPEEHGADILARDPSTGKFLISGLYNHDRHYFGLDFARSLEETLITFAHEAVHAADPQLDQYRENYQRLFEPAMKVLTRWLDGGDEARAVALDIVDHFAFEMGAQRFKEIADSIRQKREAQLKSDLREREPDEAPFEPSEEDERTLRQWIRAGIGLSIENEYRAYGYSIVLYATLKSRFHILAPSPERQAYVERFLAGDDVMATYLAVSMNPFLRARSSLFGAFLKPGPRNPSEEAATRFRLLRINKVLDELELLYLEETESFLKSLNDRIAGILHGISTADLNAPSALPDWAKPGGFDSPDNPFNVLTARITTAWVLRFRQNIDLFAGDVRAMNEPLEGLRHGILDLHDLSLGDRKLIGINYQDSPWTHQPEKLDAKLKKDLDSVPIDISRYFELAHWNPKASGMAEALDAKTLIQNLIHLRTLKATAWLDQAFPSLRNSVMGSRSFLQRLREGVFNADEIPAERVKELQEELVRAVEASHIDSDELLRLRSLLASVWLDYQAATESQWSSIATILQNKIQFMLQSLDLLGVTTTVSERDLAQQEQVSAQAFIGQLEPYFDSCEDTRSDPYRIGGFWPAKGPFTLGEASFPLTMICYQHQLYLVRQPGDYLNSMTTLVRGGAPEARIFFGARPIRLVPVPRSSP